MLTLLVARYLSCARFFIYFITLLSVMSCSACSQNMHRYKEIQHCYPIAKPIKNVRIALVLGTGGLRGLAHLAVLEVFEKEGIPVDLIVGSSAGSFIGALYCDKPNASELKTQLMTLKKEDLIDPFDKKSGKALENFLYKNLSTYCFHELKIPLIVVATSLTDNQMTLIRRGNIPSAVHASSAIPTIFSPVQLCHESLIDGGVLAPVPVEIARLFNPELIIAVNLAPRPESTEVKKSKDILTRSIDISFYEFCKMKAAQADIVIHPDFVGSDEFSDELNKDAYIKGLKAAKAAIPKIKRAMEHMGMKKKCEH